MNFIESCFHSAFYHNFEWVLQICLVLFVSCMAAYALHRISKRAIQKYSSFKRPRPVAYVIAFSVGYPGQFLIMLIAFHMILKIIEQEHPYTLIKSTMTFMPAAFIIAATWFLFKFKKAIFKNYLRARQSEFMRSSLDFSEKIATVTIFVIAFLTIIPTFGYSISGFLAFGGIGGVIVGLAAKDFLSNVLGSISLHFDNHFNVGDWINIKEKGIEGIVENIGWRNVTIRTFDKREMFVPTALLANIIIENPSRMTHRRVQLHLYTDYTCIERLDNVMSDLKLYFEGHKYIDNKAGINCVLEDFTESGPQIYISAYCSKTDWAEFLVIKQSILMDLYMLLKSHNVRITTPKVFSDAASI